MDTTFPAPQIKKGLTGIKGLAPIACSIRAVVAPPSATQPQPQIQLSLHFSPWRKEVLVQMELSHIPFPHN